MTYSFCINTNIEEFKFELAKLQLNHYSEYINHFTILTCNLER